MPLISKQTRTAFREHFVGWTLREISDVFDAADIPRGAEPTLVGGQRRGLVEEYYAGVNWDSPRDIKRLLRIYEDVLAGLAQRVTDGEADAVSDPFPHITRAQRLELQKLTNLLKRDGYVFEAGRLSAAASLDLSELEDASVLLDRHTLREHVRRLEQAVDADPAQAVGSAKELLETVSKAVLEAYGEAPDAYDTLPRLAKHAMKLLRLTTETIPESARGADSMKQVFAGMSQVVNGVAELRNLYGTGHGRTRRSGLEPRHARFVVGAAVTLSRFLLETLEARQAAQATAAR